MKCLIPNIGSTSFKFRVLDMPVETVLAQGRVERIGQPGGECADYPAAIRKCISEIAGPGKPLANLSEIGAVGFKAVHAGPLNAPRSIRQRVKGSSDTLWSRLLLVPSLGPPSTGICIVIKCRTKIKAN